MLNARRTKQSHAGIFVRASQVGKGAEDHGGLETHRGKESVLNSPELLRRLHVS